MPDKTLNEKRKDKAFKTIAVCAMVFIFMASMIMAIVLPFVDTVGVANAADVDTSADNEPVYADGVGKGYYVDYSVLNHVSMADYNGTDVVYGFYYDTSYLFDFDFRENTELTGNNKYYAVYFYSDSASSLTAYSFTIFNNYSAVGSTNYARVSLRFPYGTRNDSTTYDLMRYDKVTSLRITYVLNGFYTDTPISKVTFTADFKTTEYAKHMYFITELFDDALSEVVELKQENVRLQQEKDNLQKQHDDLQKQYDDLLNGMDFSVFNSVNLDTAPAYSNSVATSATSVVIDNRSYNGYWYYRASVEPPPINTYCDFNIGTTLLKGSDVKLTYDALYYYKGDIPENKCVELVFTEYGFSSIVNNDSATYFQLFIPVSYWLNGDLTFTIPISANYIAFSFSSVDFTVPRGAPIVNGTVGEEVVISANGAAVISSTPADSNIRHTGGLFISNFVVSGRGSNFKTAIDNANKQGFNTGYEQGLAQGKELGYLQGSKDQGDYTFLGLIGAVFDAPISAFQGLLSFEVLGVDMSAFVLALFSLAVIVVIVKIALGGK